VLRGFKELLEALWAAIRHQVSAPRGGEKWAVHEDMLSCLEGCTALAGDLVWSVLGEESISVFPSECVPCNAEQNPQHTLS
jgi:hypothetical protein